jgi:hypothetical protein
MLTLHAAGCIGSARITTRMQTEKPVADRLVCSSEGKPV